MWCIIHIVWIIIEKKYFIIMTQSGYTLFVEKSNTRRINTNIFYINHHTKPPPAWRRSILAAYLISCRRIPHLNILSNVCIPTTQSTYERCARATLHTQHTYDAYMDGGGAFLAPKTWGRSAREGRSLSRDSTPRGEPRGQRRREQWFRFSHVGRGREGIICISK